MYLHDSKAQSANDTRRLDLYPNISCSTFPCKLTKTDRISHSFRRTNNLHSDIFVKCSLAWILFCFGTMSIYLNPLSSFFFVIKWQNWRFLTWSLLCTGWKLIVLWLGPIFRGISECRLYGHLLEHRQKTHMNSHSRNYYCLIISFPFEVSNCP